MEGTKIVLSKEEAELFKKFMERHDEFEYLIKSKVFDYGVPGSVLLHLNASGNIGDMEWRPSVKMLINRPVNSLKDK